MAQGRKTGGRQKGTPNKPSPLKEHLRAHSMAYFAPRPQTNGDGTPRTLELRTKEGELYNTVMLQDADGNPLVVSDFEVDMMMMEAKDRATIHEKLLRYHTPQMQSVSAEVSLSGDITTTIEQRLAQLAAENDK
ncbi:MAG: hypothetical protein K2L55_01770 [Muribaculaceae bacterium]|nr:hypothetical protein [Muribaculaceae bacterium]